MSIVVKRVDNKQFPIEITINNKKQTFTELAGRELLRKLHAVLDPMVPVPKVFPDAFSKDHALVAMGGTPLATQHRWDAEVPDIATSIREMIKQIEDTSATIAPRMMFHSFYELAHLIRIGAFKIDDFIWNDMAIKKQINDLLAKNGENT